MRKKTDMMDTVQRIAKDNPPTRYDIHTHGSNSCPWYAHPCTQVASLIGRLAFLEDENVRLKQQLKAQSTDCAESERGE